MPRVPVSLLLAGLCMGSAAGDAFVPLAGAAVGPDGAELAAAMRGRFQNVAEAPARTTALAGETAAIVPGDYIAETNAWRAEVGAPPLAWDDTIAKVAQSWADNLERQGCDMVHSTSEWQKAAYKAAGGPEESLGENIAWACCDDPPKQGGIQVVDMWASEKKSYAYGATGDECTSHDGGTVGHYTQLVWAESNKMGCGMASCGNKGTVWVCNFYPAGNWMGEAPFCKANVPSTMPMCSGIRPGVGAGDTPCLTPSARKCEYEKECCSCKPQAGSGEKEMEEGLQDEAQGARDREEGMRNNDPSEVQEGNDEKRAGHLEVERGKAEEEEYLMNHEFHKVVEITGLDKTDFDEVKFQAAIAEVLGVPLFDVKVRMYMFMYTYIQTYFHTKMHTYIHTYIRISYIHACIHHTCVHTFYSVI
jgi:pathogenesis-related protein 1